MSLYTVIKNTLHRVAGRSLEPQEITTTSDHQTQASKHSSKQKDPACALRQAINELSGYNTQEPVELCMTRHGSGEAKKRNQTDIHMANWGAEQGHWGQRFSS